MIIEVTQEDIEKGTRGSRCNCPIARAFRRLGAVDVEVNPIMDINYSVEVKVWGPGLRRRWFVMGPGAFSFASGFDNGRSQLPGAFEAEEL